MQLAHVGLQRGAARMLSAAKAAGSGELTQAALQQSMARAEMEASGAVVRVMDETLGTLIDELV